MASLPLPGTLRELYSAEAIARRVAELGKTIASDYAGRSPVVVSILKGSFVFAADLVRAVEVSLRVEFLGVRSYDGGTETTGAVQITQDLTHSVQGEDVLVVEDIVDTGLTISYITKLLRARGATTVRVAALLDKPVRRRVTVDADYVGFTIGDAFVVGYGLDVGEEYRNLPYLAELVAKP
ncbi:MAG TPA: hypoxanthine phosphoribosyltransferase [Polyangiaceae bacterium]